MAVPEPGSGKSARQQILTATLVLLERAGYSNLTTDGIAAQARISKTTMYRLWSTKQEIVIEAARSRISVIAVPDLGSFAAEVEWLLKHRFADYRRPGMLRLVAGLVGASAGDPVLEGLFDEWVESLSRTVRQITQRGIARGDVRPDVDIMALEALVLGVVARAVVSQRGFSDETLVHIAGILGDAVVPDLSKADAAQA